MRVKTASIHKSGGFMFNEMGTVFRRASLCLVAALAACTGGDDGARRAGGTLSAEQCDHFAVGGRVTICHATGSARNPYTLIRVAESACVNAHSAHAGDYVSTDGTCGPGACLPVGGPIDATIGCCPGLVAVRGVCTDLCENVTCAAADRCHVAGTCNPLTGACSNPSAPDGAMCSDDSLCTAGDACREGSCVGVPVPLDDGNPCTADTCSPAVGVTHAPLAAGMACGDADLCNGREVCDGAGACVAGTPVATDDGNACTADACNAETGLAEHTPVADGLACDDGDACTRADACRAGACAGAAVACAPLDTCHVAGTCDPMSGACTNPAAADGTACGAGLACGAGVCADVDECAAGADNCSPNAACTNTAGGFTCACNAGYAGDGVTCADVDDCAPNPCQNGGLCTDLVGGHTCHCAGFYTGVNCEVAPACSTGLTACGGTCVNTAVSNAHCGRCDNACASGTSCSGGLCCVAGQVACGGTCRDLSGDNANCGFCGNACGAGFTCIRGVCESNVCLPPVQATGPCSRVLMREDWETDPSARWGFLNGSSGIVTTTDASACTGRFLRETILYSAGRLFSRPGIPVVGGRTYCFSGWIRGTTGTAPFIGIRASNAAGTAAGSENWLIGDRCFPTGTGTPVSPVTADGQWRWYSRQFVMPAYSYVVVELEIWAGRAAGAADFDEIQMMEGPCPAAPGVVCTPASCPTP